MGSICYLTLFLAYFKFAKVFAEFPSMASGVRLEILLQSACCCSAFSCAWCLAACVRHPAVSGRQPLSFALKDW